MSEVNAVRRKENPRRVRWEHLHYIRGGSWSLKMTSL